MARYRIVQHPAYYDPSTPRFEVERRVGFWWEQAGFFNSFGEAEQRVQQLKASEKHRIKTKVVKVYD